MIRRIFGDQKRGGDSMEEVVYEDDFSWSQLQDMLGTKRWLTVGFCTCLG